jgi:hypothetical protein
MSRGSEIRSRRIGCPEDLDYLNTDHKTWTDYNKQLLRRLLTTDDFSTEYERCPPSPTMYFGEPALEQEVQRTHAIIEAELKCLGSIMDRLELYLGPSTPVDETYSRTPIDKLEQMANRFHVVAQQLLLRHGGRETLKINDEYDVQDLLHALLLLEFDDVRPEEHTPTYAGGAARMDFLLKNEWVVVEVKCTRAGLGSKEVGEQLLVDIAKYQGHQDCKSLFCFVYDPTGRLQNPRGIERDLSHDRHGLATLVRIRPRFS